MYGMIRKEGTSKLVTQEFFLIVVPELLTCLELNPSVRQATALVALKTVVMLTQRGDKYVELEMQKSHRVLADK